MLLREVLTSTPGAERKVWRCRQAFQPTSAVLTHRQEPHSPYSWQIPNELLMIFSSKSEVWPLSTWAMVSHTVSTAPLTLPYWLPVLSQRASRALMPASYLGVQNNCSPTESPTQTCGSKWKSNLRPVHRRALDMTTSTAASTENWEETPQASSKKVARP